MILADTSGLLALYNRREPAHGAAAAAVAELDEPLVVSPYVLAELDYLVTTRMGVDAELAVLGELSGGAYVHATFTDVDVRRCAEVIDRYRDQAIGLADASLVMLAARYDTRTVLTLDRRHFTVLRTPAGDAFDLRPDAGPRV